MKYFFWILAAAVCVVACKDPEPDIPPLPSGYWGTASALKNGKPWTAAPVCRVDQIDGKNLSIKLDSFWQGNYLVETLDFYQIPPVVDTHIIFKRKTEDKPYSHFVNWDYDVALGAYDILETVQPNQLVITSYDTISGEIKGTFNLNFLVYHRPYPNAPDTVHFRDGRFHGKVNKQ